MIQRHEIHIGGAACDHDRHPVEYGGTPEKGHARSERDQRIHIRTAVHQGRKPARKEFLIDHHDDERKDHLRQRQSQVVMFKESRQREVPHVVAHRDVHEHTQESQRQDEPPFQLRRLMVFQGFLLRRKRRGLFHRRILQGGTIAGIFHGLDDRLRGRGAFHAHRVGKQGHRTGVHAFHRIDGFFHSCLTGGTAHARHNILFHIRLPHQFLQDRNQLIDAFLFALHDIFRHTAPDMRCQQLLVETVQRAGHRRYLNQNIRTVGILFDHLFNSADLPFRLAQPGHQILFLYFRALLVTHAFTLTHRQFSCLYNIPPGGICQL